MMKLKAALWIALLAWIATVIAMLHAGKAQGSTLDVIINGAPVSCSMTIKCPPDGVTPPPVVCTPPKVLQNGVCVDQPAPPNNCGPGEVFSSPPDYAWVPLTTTFVTPAKGPLSASGDTGTAVKFVADNATYPRGFLFEPFDQSGSATAKDLFISDCPHKFVPLGGNDKGCQLLAVQAGSTDFYTTFNGQSQSPYECALEAGKTYYINFRATDQPRGTVSTQFVGYGR